MHGARARSGRRREDDHERERERAAVVDVARECGAGVRANPPALSAVVDVEREHGASALVRARGGREGTGRAMRRFLYVLAFVVWLLLNLRACALLLEVWR